MAGLGILLLVGTLTQGVTYGMGIRSDAAVAALSRVSRLAPAAAEMEAVATRLEREPADTENHAAVAALVDEFEQHEVDVVSARIDPPIDDAGWARVSLALVSVTAEARSMGLSPVVAPRAAHRLRARASALRQEIEATTAQLEDDVRTGVEQTRWVSLGAWGILLLSIVGVSRWVLAAGLRRIERDREELAEAERAVLDAADGERVRLGQELHDGLCQQLGGLRLLALATQRAASDQTTRDSLESLESLAARALDMARALSHGLYPGDVRAVNLAGALERLGTEVAELGSFHFTFDGPESTPSGVTDGEAMQLYRIAQEAISNAVRHGNPRSLKIGLQAEPLTLSVEDDGIGLSSTSDGSTTAGVGLSSMHARARAVNARIKFFSTPQEGTRVVVTRSETPLDSQALDEIPVTPLTDCTTS